MKLRVGLLALSLSFALLSLSAAAVAPPYLQAWAAETVEVEAEEPESIYELRVLEGEICVYQGDTLLIHTGVAASSLPASDQTLLDGGIGANSAVELTRLLEDLTS